MLEQRMGSPRSFETVFILGILVAVASGVSHAQDEVQPPPYQMAGSNHIMVGVVWNEAAVRKALPPGITPVKEMTGAINIYQAEKGYVIGPYQSVYFWVDIEGFDSPDHIKGRWMLAGVYGPQDKTSAALKRYMGFPVRVGSSRMESTAEGKRAVGTVNGLDFVTVEIKSLSGTCEAAAGLLNYPALLPNTTQLVVNEIPFVGEFCKAEPVSVNVNAPSGDPFAAYRIEKIIWAAEFKNASFSFALPHPARR